ncbi:MAG: hypothetical protein L6Q54_12120 [Leptospiraceae bacterium]|nr:hypothetical protein [Leptospiraceae bacterium]MCK6381977.1 hypothetical protein [Leptospiraceae bacterium]NUM42910.1 hypothetical protein [Leptospiraceae bacterium]
MEKFTPKPILSKAELKQIKKSRSRFEGKKVITDDVKKLKSLKVSPEIPDSEKIHYYKEPIWIEYYIPKESRFALETKFMFIKLIDVIPRNSPYDDILREAIKWDALIDIVGVIEKYPEYEKIIQNSYRNSFSMFEKISTSYDEFKKTEDAEVLKIPVYLTETLMLFEPTIASLEILGEFAMYNLNWLIRKLNLQNIEFSLEDRTTSILIKRRNEYWEENNLLVDDDFELLSALFYEQAYPHRGAQELEEMDFLIH